MTAAPRSTHADWLAAVRADLDIRDVDELRTPLGDGVELQALFTRADVPSSPEPAGDAGAAPLPAEPNIPRRTRLATVRFETGRLDTGRLDTGRSAGIDGFDLVRIADPEVERQLARGAADAVRSLDPACTALTLSPTPDGVAALATLNRTGLGHAIVLDVIDGAGDPSPARELAGTLAAAAAVLRGLPAGGAAAVAGRMLVPVRIDTDLVTQIAKVRAARWVWHDLLLAFGVEHLRAPPRIWAKASDACFSAIDPDLNLVRSTLQAFAAVAAGCDVFEPLAFDPVEAPAESLRLAANQLRLLRHETHAERVADAAAGSFAIESLTHQIAHGAWRLLGIGESHGRAGRPLDALPAADRERHGARVLVGTNRFADPSARTTTPPAAAHARAAAPYEALRRRTAAHPPIAVVLLPFGPPDAARAHTEWAADLLRIAGVEALHAEACASLALAREALRRHAGTHVIVCCGVDDASSTFVRGVLALLTAAAPRPLLYATGTAPAGSETWGAIGFLHRGLDPIGTLSGILDRLGVRAAAESA